MCPKPSWLHAPSKQTDAGSARAGIPFFLSAIVCPSLPVVMEQATQCKR
jgi:hypothetical protein